ncbi:microcystin degradation protein MlrC [Mycoplana sp. BE70]|uniref:M81 family metallopeptidase n=1 Tax=Mycoplana sp. BE70 TaxID=2817775 RepID=UPI002860057D|nr:M81 family metallopeptidase [Mycoplana sp. BE70]MDR6759285.1 microcystin degradation protein MlrC [Mycoplana sp. BE70]
MSFQVLTAEFKHESNTFNRNLTGYDAFRGKFLYFGEEAVARRSQANTELAGFLDAAKTHGWNVEHVLSTTAEPSGMVTRDAFDRLAGPIVEAARRRKDSLSGILLGLHGAMVTEFCEDGEGELLARLREAVGDEIPIAITLDLHANVTPKMCDLANVIVSYKTYPHIDMRERGGQAGDILQQAMQGEIKPRTIRVHLPMLDETSTGRTDLGPMIDWVARAKEYETRPNVFAVSINSGFGNADIADVGPTVLVTCQGDDTEHFAFANRIAGEMWAGRHKSYNTYYSVEDAATVCKAHSASKPIVVADYADNPGGGGYGDSTELLRALLDAKVENACFGPLLDPNVAQELSTVAVGETVTVNAGGKTDARFGGGPLALTGTLMLTSDDGVFTGNGPMIGGLQLSFGKTAVLRVEGIDILIVSHVTQMLDLQQFAAFGIDPTKKSVVALKSMQHFRAAFEPIADKVIVCDSGALCTLQLEKLPYRNVPRPIFPLDKAMEYVAGAS